MFRNQMNLKLTAKSEQRSNLLFKLNKQKKQKKKKHEEKFEIKNEEQFCCRKVANHKNKQIILLLDFSSQFKQKYSETTVMLISIPIL